MKRLGVFIICLVTAIAFAACTPTEDRSPGPLTSAVSPSPLPESAYKAAITMVNPAPSTLHAGEAASLKVRVKNMGTVAWPALSPGAKGRVTLGNHWLDKNGKTLIGDDGRAELPHDVKSGEEVELTLNIKARKTAAVHLELDMVHETLSWFTAHGSGW